MRLALIALAVTCACTQPRSARCKQVCAREYECVAQTSSGIPFDEKECVAACSALEADQDNQAKVQKQYDCVMTQADCTAVVKKCN